MDVNCSDSETRRVICFCRNSLAQFIYIEVFYQPKVTQCGQDRSEVKTLLLQCCALRKFHAIEGHNERDQNTIDRRSKRALSIRLRSTHFILSYLLTSRLEVQTNLATSAPRMRNRNLEKSIADSSGCTQLTSTRVLACSVQNQK